MNSAVAAQPSSEGLELDESAKARSSSLRSAALSSYVGSAIEYYDFFIYGTAAAVVFPTVFFPDLSHMMATVASLGTFAAAFLARPIGAAAFGHFGDRIGRKRALLVTLAIMGASTIGVGLIPGAAVIGSLAPVLLVMLRLLQGLALGGEWAGSALLSAEHAPANQRGRYGMFTQLGLGSGLVLANLAFLLSNSSVGGGNQAFIAWVWRIPFLASVALIVVAVYIRRRVDETPVFADAAITRHASGNDSGAPIAVLMRHQRRQVVLAAGTVVGAAMLLYQVGTFITHYAALHLGYSMNFVLLAGVVGGLCSVALAAWAAIRSDAVGRRGILIVGYGLAVPWSLVVFPLIQHGNQLTFAAAVGVTYVIIGVCLGPLAAYLPEIFATRYRYTGTGLSHSVGTIMGGALAPVLSEPLLAAYGGWAIGTMMALLAGISLVSVCLLPETAGTRLDDSPTTEHTG